jgi:hypothetical protein
MSTFPAKLDALAKMITVAVVVAVVVPFITIGQHFGANHDYKIVLVPVLLIAAFLFTVLYKPKSFTINPSVLKITQVGFSKVIPMTDIEHIEVADRKELGLGLRTFGSGGFLGYLGKFWYSKIGHITFYVTDRDKMLLVRLKTGKKIMISPDDQVGFLNAYRASKG